MIVQPVFEFLAIGNVQQGGVGFCCLDGDSGFAQQALAEEMDGGACADRQFTPLRCKVVAGVAAQGDDFVLRAESGIFCAAAIKYMSQDGMVAVLFETCAQIVGWGNRLGFACKCSSVLAGQGDKVEFDTYALQAFCERKVFGAV